MRIQDLDKRDRPREKALKYGIETLETAELLALIIGHGIKNYSALDMAHSLLSRYTLEQISLLSYSEWKEEKGFQDPQIWKIMASIELGKRMLSYAHSESEVMRSASDVVLKYLPLYANKEQEYMVLIMLNSRNRILGEKVIFQGTSNELSVSISEVFTHLVRKNAKKFYVLHNHPSGEVEPSTDDIRTTLALKEMGEQLHIQLKDHIILGKEDYYSFLENQLI